MRAPFTSLQRVSCLSEDILDSFYEELALTLEREFEWINLGQDIGSEGIRHSKRSYQPDRLVVKMRLRSRH